MRRQRGLDHLAVGARRGQVEPGQVRGVAAQRDGQRRRIRQPAAADLAAREHLAHEVRHRHDLPLQALRRVHGEDLRRGPAPPRPRRGRTPPPRARRCRGSRAARAAVETSAPAVKSATTSANASRCARPTRPGTGGGLGVEQEQALDVRDEVGQRHRRPRPQPAQLRRKPADPGEARRRVAAGRARVVQRVDEARLLGVLAGQRTERELGGRRAVPRERRGPVRAPAPAPRAPRGLPRRAASAARSAAVPPPARTVDRPPGAGR